MKQGGALNGERSRKWGSRKFCLESDTVTSEPWNLTLSEIPANEMHTDWIFLLTINFTNFSAVRSLNAWQCNGKPWLWTGLFPDSGQASSLFPNKSEEWWSWGIIRCKLITRQANQREKTEICLKAFLFIEKYQSITNRKYNYLNNSTKFWRPI